nr:extensin-like [Chelonoidis abingdonii]
MASSTWSAPAPLATSAPRKDSSRDARHRHGSSWGPSDGRHHSHSAVPQKKKKPDNRFPQAKPQEVRPQAGRSLASPSGAVSTPVQVKLLSAAPPRSPVPTQQLKLPSTPKAYHAARDFLHLTALFSPARGESSVLAEPCPPVHSKEKPAMLRHSPSPCLLVPTWSNREPSRSLSSQCSRHRGSAPRWSIVSETSESEPDSYRSSRSRSRRARSGRDRREQQAWPPQWQNPLQWPFWTPWAYHQGPRSVTSSVASVTFVPPSAVHPSPAPTVPTPLPPAPSSTQALCSAPTLAPAFTTSMQARTAPVLMSAPGPPTPAVPLNVPKQLPLETLMPTLAAVPTVPAPSLAPSPPTRPRSHVIHPRQMVGSFHYQHTLPPAHCQMSHWQGRP